MVEKFVVGQDPGEHKLSEVHCNTDQKRKKNNKHNSMNTNIYIAPFPINFCNKSGVRLTAEIAGELATNLHKLTQLIDN